LKEVLGSFKWLCFFLFYIVFFFIRVGVCWGGGGGGLAREILAS